ncbi:MAG: DUF3857 domain-containing protein [Bacteroidia bacterium]|nr:DUF3857 domain-containing protein [Bacteroidia bacterium]
MRKIILLLLFSYFIISARAGEFSLPYLLADNPDFSVLTKNYDLKTIDELEVLDERVIEYSYDKDGALFEYFYLHIVKYVNSEEAIDRNNKIYVSFNRVMELVAYNARVISDGKGIKLLGKDALKEGTNSEGQKVQFFAVSGAEKGSFIEYFYLVKRSATVSGSYLTFQAKMPTLKSVFKIISPENLVFVTRSLNGYANMINDTTLSERNYLKAETMNIPKLDNESFGNEGGNKMKVIYQLYLNKSKGKKNPYNYGIVSQNIFESIHTTLNKTETKEIEKILKNSEMKLARDEENKIFKIEDYVKTHFEYVQNSDERFEKLEDIFKLKSYNSLGAIKLMYLLYEAAGIEKEIVVTSSRYEIRFDADFDSWAYLDEYLLYFPSIKKIMMPGATTYRLGVIPYGYIENNGLFIKKISVGNINTGAGKVNFIPAYPAEHTQHNMYITSKLNAMMDSLDVSYRQVYTGYYAQAIQPDFDFLAKDKLKEFEERIVKTLSDNINIKSIQIENKGVSNLMINPLILNSTFSSSHFINKAGTKVLLKFGDLIGPQSELYQEKDRVLPVENDYNRIYNREIIFMVPDGYKIKNSAELKMQIQPFLANGDGAGFVSTYTLQDNKLEVKIKEYYNQLNFPKSEYEKYRSVINAAANFNKIVLVLEKL